MSEPTKTPTCGLCGFPMPKGEEMFQYHGYSGPCPVGYGESRPEPPSKEPTKTPLERLVEAAVEAAWSLERLLHLAPEDTTTEDRRQANLKREMLIAALAAFEAAEPEHCEGCDGTTCGATYYAHAPEPCPDGETHHHMCPGIGARKP